MIAPHRASLLTALLCCSGLLVSSSSALAQQENQIRKAVEWAESFEKQQPQPDWEKAREIYESLLAQKDPGLNIRERYQNALRRCWQTRRHQDVSYRKEVLSVEYGQALRLNRIISRTLLDQSVDKKKLTSTKLFHKGLEELDAALADPFFVREHVPAEKHAQVAAFRAMLKKKWGDKANLTRDKAIDEIGKVALLAEEELGLNPTTIVMEFACGACYAIDEYTVYLTPNQLRELAQSLLRSEAIGVGLILTTRDSNVVVSAVGDGSPAQLANIRINDLLLSVNKKAVKDLSLLAVKELLEGPVGSMVNVEVQTPGDANVRMITMARERATVPSVDAFLLQGTPYAILKINSFTETTVQDVDDALAQFAKAEIKGLILDLRENNGGVFDASIETARRFLSKGIIASTVHQDSKYNQVYVAKNPKALTLPMVLLVDGDTASAAEVLAGALKDNDRAYLIGKTTFGKGCTQCVLRLPNASGNLPTGGMRLTVARFFSPKGISYSGRGVVPHFIIEDPMASSQSMPSPYLVKAIDELNRMTMPK